MCQIRPAQEIWSVCVCVCVRPTPLLTLLLSEENWFGRRERYLDEWKRRMTENEHTREMERERVEGSLAHLSFPSLQKTILQTSRLPSTMMHTDTFLHNARFNKAIHWQTSQLIVSLTAAYTKIKLVFCGTKMSRPLIPYFCFNSLSNEHQNKMGHY